MKPGMILYQSKYGATKKYADWLAKRTGFDCIETSKAEAKTVMQYETLILCGGIYASGIAGLSFLKKHMSHLDGTRIAVFCVGASPYDKGALDTIRACNMKDALIHIPLFYGRGAWDESRMSLKDRTLCRLLQKAVAKKGPHTYEPWMAALIGAIGQSCDWTDQKYLEPLMDWLQIDVKQGEDDT